MMSALSFLDSSLELNDCMIAQRGRGRDDIWESRIGTAEEEEVQKNYAV